MSITEWWTTTSGGPFLRVLLRGLMWGLIILFAFSLRPGSLFAQEPINDPLVGEEEATIEAPEQVDVEPVAEDEEIAARLLRIMASTEWFQNPTVDVRDGVVFIDGETRTEEYRTWAGNLARNTQDVVAVVNRLAVIPRSPWDFSPALTELRTIGRETLQVLPLLLFGLFILVLAWYAMRYASHLSDTLLRRRIQNNFLRNLATTALSIPVFLLGLYLVLQVSGLTRLAVTVLGGTGIAGLIVGIGFRDIMENFLATILISTRNPFKAGDRIEVAGHLGIVQQVNSRTTVLMSLDGNHIQIPNAIIYKSTIRNFTANPNRRLEFGVGVGYDDDLSGVQQTIIDVLTSHPTVLATPEPLALVDGLGAATVNLRIFFWVDTSRHEEIKVKSSVIRLVKRALDENGYSMPDEAREVIFPNGVPLTGVPWQQIVDATHGTDPVNREDRQDRAPALPRQTQRTTPSRKQTNGSAVQVTAPLATQAEGGLANEDEQIKEQARSARTPEEDTNLLQE